MTQPKSFRSKLQKIEQKKHDEKIAARNDDLAFEQRVKKKIHDEKLCEKDKIGISKKIFAWKDQFLRTTEGARVFKHTDKELWVFGGSWGNELPRYPGGCWSRIYIIKNGFEYWQGYKWMGGSPVLRFYKPEEMGKELYKEYLEKLLQKIESGEVYDSIVELNMD